MRQLTGEEKSDILTKLNHAETMLEKCKNGYTDGLVFSCMVEIEEVKDIIFGGKN